MSGRYLTDMANVLRAAGLNVVEHDGWQTRGRSTGGYQGNRPYCIMWHHTASNASPESDVLYMIRNSDSRPIANLYLARDGTVHVMAAGATNTNGKGKALAFSKGTVPQDTMNLHAIGIEAANSGVGEPWPQVQVDAFFKASNALAAAYGMTPTDLASHNLYAPDRKIDPARASVVQGPWKPQSTGTKADSWTTDSIRAEASARAGAQPPLPGPTPDPTPPPPFVPGPPAPKPTKDDDTMVVALDSNGTAWVGDGITRYPIADEAIFNNMVVLGKSGALRFVNTSGQTVSGWGNVATAGPDLIAALGRA